MPAIDFSDGPISVAVFGDSLSYPVGRTDQFADRDWLRWADPEGAHLHLVANHGVPTETTSDMLRRLDEVVEEHADIVIVLGGTNDGALGADITITNLSAIYDALTADGSRVVAMTIPPRLVIIPDPANAGGWLPDTQLVEHRQTVNDWMREHVEQDWLGALLVDLDLALGADFNGDVFVDTVHFNAAGAAAVGQALGARLGLIP